MLARIQAEDPNVGARQFGIVDLVNAPLSFTGAQAGRAKKSVAGTVGDLVYAILGNVLANTLVIDECEAVLRTSGGDLAERVLAAMVAARELGGDGRCSCGLGSLGDCGIPTDFEKSAHIGFMIVARIGDADGSCVVGASCANGTYHLRIDVKRRDAVHGSPDPVDQMVARYAEWRAARSGRPDGLRSRVIAVDALPADGATETTVRIELVDLDGVRVPHGGATVEVLPESELVERIGPVADHGDGTYSATVRASTDHGVERLIVRASDELVRATLYPYPELRLDPAEGLHAGLDRLSASDPRPVPLVVNEPARPRAKFWLVTRLSGPQRIGPGPGAGASAWRGLVPGGAPFFPGPPGTLDAHGRGAAEFTASAAVLAPLVGATLEWTALVRGGGAPLETNTARVPIVP
jgi:hypothetical protein